MRSRIPQNPQRSAGVFIVERDTPGFTVGEIEDLCGMRANPVSSLFLEDCRVPETNLLGRPGDGIKIGLATLDTGRIGIAAQALGIAQAAFEDSVRYSKERQQFRKPISSFQTIQNYLADMATEIDAARLLLYRACAVKDAGRPFGAEAAMAKLYCSAHGDAGDEPGRPDPRGIRLQQGVRRGALLPGREGHGNL